MQVNIGHIKMPNKNHITNSLLPAIWRSIIIALIPAIIWLAINIRYTYHKERANNIKYTARVNRFADTACISRWETKVPVNLNIFKCK